ncbi:hypothetical protein [Arthrobacter sp. W4I7]|uniref:hypothetical protein n=1 Tax=Arthrobacter sp. W4I7 TaxID=3042296 RepID=UPI002784CCEE|nr:hypothetical protein [Arthrobacter sp. W4I7]MDQ0691429.1 hypothetical protein [Arthrobacter sp. W4I7]
MTNVIAFAMVYMELDRGGPVSRRHTPRPDLPRADFRFPQDEDHDAVKEVAARSSVKTGWTAAFIDHLYFSLSNSLALSPTDTMPLSARAKALMGLEAFGGFVLLALVIAHGISLLGQITSPSCGAQAEAFAAGRRVRRVQPSVVLTR